MKKKFENASGCIMHPKVLKLLLTMKLILILVCGLGLLGGMAEESYSQATKLTFSIEKATVRDVLLYIENHSEFSFMYDNKEIDVDRVVDINVKDEKIDAILNQLFSENQITYEAVGRHIIIVPVKDNSNHGSIGESVQQNNVSGTVTDNNGQTLPGVTVVVKGTTNGTVTNVDGRYSLPKVSVGAILQFSFMGMRSQEIVVGNQSTIDVTMLQDVIGIEEVVAVGYGVQKKASITGSVASIQTEEITSVKAPSVSNSLAGKLPGLRAIQRSGAPGDDVAQIDIRGFGSPLVIVDGVERSFSQMDANDIESISILKDASAAVYGFKGANGVILVTTKKGKMSKPTIRYNGYYGLQTETRWPELFDAYEYASLWNEAQLNVGVRAPYTQEELDKYKAGNDPDYPNNNWWELMTRDFTPQMYHNLSVSGGAEKVKYFFSVGYTSQYGIWASKEENFSKYNVRSNVSAEITDGLTVGLQLSGRLDTRDKPYDAGRFHTYFKVHPNVPIYANNNPEYYQAIGDNVNPIQGLYKDEMGYDKRDRREFNGTFTFDWEVPWIKGLTAKALLAYDYGNEFTKQWSKEYAAYQYDEITETYTKKARKLLSELNSRAENSFTPTQQYSLNYQNTFDKNDFSGLLLWEMKNYREDWISAYRQFFISAIDQISAGDNTNKNNGGGQYENSHEGLVGRVNYAFSSKYLAEISFRYDGSYKFADDRRWGFFPAVSLGWRISEEAFFKENVPFVNNLKIRGSYGKVGDEGALSAFQYMSGYYYPSGNYVLGSGGVSNGLSDKGLPNKNLTWYESTTANIGFESLFWEGLLSAEFDFFERRRDGLLGNRLLTLPSTFGKSLPQENLNSDRTRGFELVVGHRNKIGKVSYSIKANFTTTREFNRYVERAAAGNMYDNWRYNNNDRYKSITWGYEDIGQFQSFEEILNAPIQDGNGNNSLLPGDIRFKDLNGDGIISWLDQKPIGHSSVPSMFYGLDLSANYKGFDFTAFFQGAAGHELNVIETWTDPFIQQGLGNGVIFWLDRWHRENPEDINSQWVSGYMPALRPSGFSLNNQTSTWTLLKQDYLRLKTLEIGYSLPKPWLSRVKLESVRIYVNSYNSLTMTKGRRMKYMDPENGDAYIKAYPPMKSFNFGINLTF